MSKLIESSLAQQSVLEYLPRTFDLGVPKAAVQTFEALRGQASDFRISEIVRVQTGLNKIEEGQFEDEVEKKTLERIKDLQENAYQEAYQLGLEEGRREAFQQASGAIDEKLESFGSLIDSLTKLKSELLVQNERHLIQLAFQMAERLAAHEISVNPEATVGLLRQAIEIAQAEENLTVQVAPSHLEYLESLRAETGREFEFLKKVRIEANEQLSQGGCVVISNYGEVDSRLEERVKQLWTGLDEVLPRAKAKVSVAS